MIVLRAVLRSSSSTRTQILGVAGVVFAVHLAVVLVVGDQGWDDGAITLAFARTFAETGRIALTPGSEQVEGFSSVAWFLLMAAAARLGAGNYDSLIVTAQLAAAVCASAGAAMFFTVARRHVGPTTAAVAAVAVFISAPFLNESMNGMEMSLLALVALALVELLDGPPRIGALATLGALASTVRFEAAGYVLLAAAVLFPMACARRGAVAVAAGAVAGFVVLTGWRLWYFGAVLPNTVIAKRWAPYSSGGLRAHLVAAAEPFYVMAAVVLAVAVIVFAARRALDWSGPWPLDATLLFALAYFGTVCAFNVAIGANWGYHGRMQLSGLPLAVLVTLAALHQVGLRWTRKAAGSAAAALVVGSLVVLQWVNLGYALNPGPVARSTGVTPAGYRETGAAVDRVRHELGAEQLSFMTPDIGGSSLAYPRLQFVDMGLLANARLARDGYAGFDRYLADTRPDLIDAHTMWAEASGIYRSPQFVDGYRPIVVQGMWLYVRADLAERLPSQPAPGVVGAGLKYRGDPEDESFIAAHRREPVYLS